MQHSGVNRVHKVGYNNQVKPQKPFSTGPGYFMVDMGDSAHSKRTPKQRSAVMDFEDECEAV